MSRLLVLGDGRYREMVAEWLQNAAGVEVVDCDPVLGDCVMYVKLEAVRYDGFVFIGYDDPVTRGALALVCDRAVLIPLLDAASAPPDPTHDGYLFRLPKALGVRDAEERETILRQVPKASAVPCEVFGRGEPDASALTRLVGRTTSGPWQWADFVEAVEHEVHEHDEAVRGDPIEGHS